MKNAKKFMMVVVIVVQSCAISNVTFLVKSQFRKFFLVLMLMSYLVHKIPSLLSALNLASKQENVGTLAKESVDKSVQIMTVKN